MPPLAVGAPELDAEPLLIDDAPATAVVLPVLLDECDGERLKVAVAVFEADAPAECVLVPLPLRLRDGVPVLDAEGTLHDATTASFLYVPTHGSSNTPFVAVKAQ